jgi:hypothetical protein
VGANAHPFFIGCGVIVVFRRFGTLFFLTHAFFESMPLLPTVDEPRNLDQHSRPRLIRLIVAIAHRRVLDERK